MASDGEKKSLLTKLKDYFGGSTYSQYILPNKVKLQNLLVALVAFALEQLLNNEVFSCPAYHYKSYGWTFQLVPFICLFFLNLLVIVDNSCLSICIYSSVRRYKRESIYGGCRDQLEPCGSTFVTSLVGPFVWLISTMLRGRFYVCARLGYDVYLMPNITEEFVDVRVINMTVKEYESWVHEYESTAHVIAWVCLVLLVGVGTFMVLCSRCYLKENERLIGLMEYEKREAIAAFAQFKHWADNKKNDEIEEPVMKAKGMPEVAGREMVLFLIKKFQFEEHKASEFHNENIFVEVYDDLISLYPRVIKGNINYPYRCSLEHDFDDVDDIASICCGSTCCVSSVSRNKQLERMKRAKYLLKMFFKHKEKKTRDMGTGTEGTTGEDTTDGREVLESVITGGNHRLSADSEHPSTLPTDTTGVSLAPPPMQPSLVSGEDIELHELEHTERDNLLVV